MPFDFLRRGKDQPAATAAQSAGGGPPRGTKGIAFDGLTEDWRLIGKMLLDGRLSDVLNRREAIPLSDVSWAPIDGSEPFSPAPGLKSIDPYDLIVVLAGADSLPPMSDEERAAHRVHKVNFDVVLEAPPFRVTGTVYLFPGDDPERLMNRATEMFVPVTNAVTLLGERRINEEAVDAVLVNRSYLRTIEQLDRPSGGPDPGG